MAQVFTNILSTKFALQIKLQALYCQNFVSYGSRLSEVFFTFWLLPVAAILLTYCKVGLLSACANTFRRKVLVK